MSKAPEAQVSAADHAERMCALTGEIHRKIRDGDLREALARIGFLGHALGDCLGDLTAALAHANQSGFLDRMPEESGDG